MVVAKNSLLQSYFGPPSPFQSLSRPRDLVELTHALEAIAPEKVLVVGGGTNSLLWDKDPWEGLGVDLTAMTTISRLDDRRLEVDAGVENSALVRYCLDQNLGDLSWMYRLPGTVGGTVRMNARCYGGEISNHVKEVTSFEPTPNGPPILRQRTANMFQGYKDTVFMSSPEIIARVTLELDPLDSPESSWKNMQQCEADRVSKKQFEHPSCGCVFKNHYDPRIGAPSGLLLELAGAQALTQGHASVSPYHANFIWNKEHKASAEEILRLAMKMRTSVWDHFGLWLDWEMEVLGNLPPTLRQELEQKRSFELKEKPLERARDLFAKRRGFAHPPTPRAPQEGPPLPST